MPPGKAEVVLKEKPATFTPGEAFYVTFGLRNLGEDDLIFMDTTNRETGKYVKQYSDWMTKGASQSVRIRMVVDQNSTLKAVTKAGHVIDSTELVDDQVFFEIPVAQVTECTEGKRETLEYCNDGSVKRERRCENGQWKEYSYTCPKDTECPEGVHEPLKKCPDGSIKEEKVCENGQWKFYDYGCPECKEGEREVLEFCPDGINVKRERVCENGKWQEYSYTCPVETECSEGAAEVLEYCDDGYTVKRERRCENGQWVYYDYTCPEAPTPPPSEESILEMILRMIRERLGLE